VRKSDLLAELTDVLLDGVPHDLLLLSVGIDNKPWGHYQPYLWQLMRKPRGSGKIQKLQAKQHQRPDTVEEGKNLKYFGQMLKHTAKG